MRLMLMQQWKKLFRYGSVDSYPCVELRSILVPERHKIGQSARLMFFELANLDPQIKRRKNTAQTINLEVCFFLCSPAHKAERFPA